MTEGESKYIPTEEEMGLAQDQMDRVQQLMTEDREEAYTSLSEADKELLKECNLKYSNGSEMNATIEGDVRGHQIFIKLTNQLKSQPGEVGMVRVEGLVDGKPISLSQSVDLYIKYRKVAKFQTEMEGQNMNREKYVEQAKREEADEVVKKLLS